MSVNVKRKRHANAWYLSFLEIKANSDPAGWIDVAVTLTLASRQMFFIALSDHIYRLPVVSTKDNGRIYHGFGQKVSDPRR